MAPKSEIVRESRRGKTLQFTMETSRKALMREANIWKLNLKGSQFGNGTLFRLRRPWLIGMSIGKSFCNRQYCNSGVGHNGTVCAFS
jgi:hypothetical protein